MSQQSLEDRVAALEQAVTALQQHARKPRWWERPRPPLTPEELEDHLAMEAYGRYYRETGKDPPPGWKPGDPIPEPDETWCPR
jgi:hypothetical protein